ncbi:MAG: sulfotransferase [Phycisphaerales bacterium]|nr:sulfotransferase [Phycisphaerales bacterium]
MVMSDLERQAEQIRKLLVSNDHDLAMMQCESLLADYPQEKLAWMVMGHVYRASSDMYRAGKAYDRAVALGETRAETFIHAAYAWRMTGNADASFDRLDHCVRLHGRSDQVSFAKAEAMERLGDFDGAEAALDEVGAHAKEQKQVPYVRGMVAIGRRDFGCAVDHLRAVVDDPKADPMLHMACYFQLAKLHDKQGEYDLAWQCAVKANHAPGPPAEVSLNAVKTEELLRGLSPDIFDVAAKASSPGEEGVFIVGMPRSGTSLIEQIFSMHSEVACAGEAAAAHLIYTRLSREIDTFNPYPLNLIDMRVADADRLQAQYLEATSWIDPTAKRMSNKSLTLPLNLPLLSVVMPGSRAILLRRHPLDNAVSCFTTPLRAGGGHQWAGSLKTIGDTQLAFHRLMTWYQEHLPMKLLPLVYEELVSDQESQTRRLIDFLGVDWEPACLEFHTSRRVAQTISYDQVNRKMYTSSDGRWKNYEKHLGPLIDQIESILP